MPSPNPADLTNLQAIKTNLLQTLAAETAYQVVNGPKPSYQLDGEQYQWSEYRQAIIDKIEQLNRLIQLEQGPYFLVMRATSGG